MDNPNFEFMTFRELKEFITYNDLSRKESEKIKSVVAKFDIIEFVDFLLKIDKVSEFYTNEEILEILNTYKNKNNKIPFTPALIINLLKYDESLISFFSNWYAIPNLLHVFSNKIEFEFICNKLVDYHGIYEVLYWLNSPMDQEKREKTLPVLFKRLAKEYTGFNKEQIKFLNNLYTGFNQKIDWDEFIIFLKKIDSSYDFMWLLSFYDRFPEVCNYIKKDIPDTENVELMKKVKDAFKYNFGIMVEIINVDLLNDELKKLYLDALEILKHRKKVNTLYSNNNFDYDLVAKIYPALGLDITLSLLKYHSNAYQNILTLIEKNHVNYILKYIEFYESHEIFPKNDKAIHEAFQSIDKCWELFYELVNNDITFEKEDVYNFREVLLNWNFFGHMSIKSIDELKSYDEKIANYAFNLRYAEDYRLLLGYLNYLDFSKLMEGYNISDLSVIKFLYDSILESNTITKEDMFTKEDVDLIKFLQCIMSEDLNNIKLHCQKRYNEGKHLSIAYQFQKLTEKIKRLYEKEYNSKLSKLSSFEDCSKQIYKDVEIISVKDKDFNFLFHHLYGYDPSFNDYPAMIEKDPSLWTNLEGSTTLSLSSISSKNIFHVMGRRKGIKFLFNYIPEGALICSANGDVGIEHGGHALNPNYCEVIYYDMDTLNNLTREAKRYNEVACYREGMIPCAVAIFDPFPTEEEIKAAQYFNTPIFYINKGLCNKNIEISRKKASEEMETKVTKENLKKLISNSNENCSNKINYLLTLIGFQKNQDLLTIDEVNELMKYIYRLSSIMHLGVEIKRKIKWMWKANLLANEISPLYKLHNVALTDQYAIQTKTKRCFWTNIKTKYLDFGMSRVDAENLIAITNLKRKLNISCLDQCDYLDSSKSILELSAYKIYGPRIEKVSLSLNGLDTIVKESVLAWFFNGSKNLKNSNLVYKENGELVINSNLRITDILEEQPEVGKYTKKNIYGSVFDKLINGKLNEQELIIITEILDALDSISDEEFINIFSGYLNLPELENEKHILIEKLLLRKQSFPKELRVLLGSARKLEK